MTRLLLFLLGALTVNRPGLREAAWRGPGDRDTGTGPGTGQADPGGAGGRPPPDGWPPAPPGYARDASFRRRRLLRRAGWAAALLAAGLIFRRAIASVMLAALAAGLHLIGVNAHLPSIRFGWPWQAISTGTATDTSLGPWVLQKIEGISRPALGEARFTFLFTLKVSKSIGPWPCWYAGTFYAVGRASATVLLNPGPAWWAPETGHYRLQVLSRPAGGKPGRVSVTMTLPQPQLPRSVHDVTIDTIPSRPVATRHSWTYPGLGCGAALHPQFPESVLYAEAQRIAFYKAGHAPQVTGPLIRTAQKEAVQTVRGNFIQPTVNALGYALARFSVRWARPG